MRSTPCLPAETAGMLLQRCRTHWLGGALPSRSPRCCRRALTARHRTPRACLVSEPGSSAGSGLVSPLLSSSTGFSSSAHLTQALTPEFCAQPYLFFCYVLPWSLQCIPLVSKSQGETDHQSSSPVQPVLLASNSTTNTYLTAFSPIQPA